MKKFLSIAISLLFVFLTCSAPVSANTELIANDIIVSVNSDNKISPQLKEVINSAHNNKAISVTIELKDTIDLDNVEKTALEKSALSTSEMSLLNTSSDKLSDSENESLQIKRMAVYDKIAVERNAILKEHYSNSNQKFVSNAKLSNDKIGSVGIFTPFIRNVQLTPSEIIEISKREDVVLIDVTNNNKVENFDSINNTYKIIRGNTAVDAGYKGSGIKVGLVELGRPIESVMGSDFTNIIFTDSNTCTADNNKHATTVCGIIKKMAPSCTVYSRTSFTISEFITDCEYLIDNYSVHVINISAGELSSTGAYNSTTREMDMLIKNTSVPIVVASGNIDGSGRTNVNVLGLGPNVITVGSANSTGTNQAASGAYTLRSSCIYGEATGTINKPDICAPAQVSIYSYGEQGGTSFAAPHVTGTIVQMMARNSGLRDKPQVIKAAIMASATFNCGTSMSYVAGTKASNQEGAGVIDAGFCYQVAKNGRRAHFDATSSSSSFTYDVYCDSTTKPFRVACAWDVLSTSSATNRTDYDMNIYKDGDLVAYSIAFSNSTTTPNSNYEIVELSPSVLSQHGAGYYEVEIVRVGSYNGSGTTRIGLAWEQY